MFFKPFEDLHMEKQLFEKYVNTLYKMLISEIQFIISIILLYLHYAILSDIYVYTICV